jgi:hypothetical protein
MGAGEAYRDNLQSAKRKQEANRQLLKTRELKLLDLNNGQDQDSYIYQNVCKNSPKEEVCTLDRTYKVLHVRIPEGMYGIAMECGKESLEGVCKFELVRGSNRDYLHG